MVYTLRLGRNAFGIESSNLSSSTKQRKSHPMAGDGCGLENR